MATNNSKIAQTTAVLLDTAVALCRSCAETRLIIQTTERVGHAFGYRNVEVIVNPELIGVTVHTANESYTLFKKVQHIGINMNSLTSITQLCLQAEHGKLSFKEFAQILKDMTPHHYHPLLMCLIIALATLAFAFLNGGGLPAILEGQGSSMCAVAFISGFVTMAVRLLLQKYQLFTIFIFACCGFIGTLTSYYLGTQVFNLTAENLTVTMFVSVLLLVPGFPFVNGVLDIFKGYNVMGCARLLTTLILLFAVSVGIIMAFALCELERW